MSTYLVVEESLDDERTAANQNVPVFQAHGSLDPMVPLQRGEAARAALAAREYDVTWRTYAMAHSVCLDEIRDIREFLVPLLSCPT